VQLRLRHLGSVVLLGLIAASSSPLSAQTTYEVNVIGDDIPDGCDPLTMTTDCTLREAILAANASAGFDTITFDITGAAPHVIVTQSVLPNVVDSVLIDGTTEPDWSAGLPSVEVRGQSGAWAGLTITAGNSTVRGLIVRDFSNGIVLQTGGNNLIEGNAIGIDPSGGAGDPNTTGIMVTSDDNTIGGTTAAARNVISSNTVAGVFVTGALATGNKVIGNYIGTDAAGTSASGNLQAGVRIGGAAGGNTVGGPTAGERNIISGNWRGVHILGSSENNVLEGNYVGIGVAGSSAVGNVRSGIEVQNSNNNEIKANVLSGNREGILIGQNSSNTIVLGNLVGTDASGSAALPNAEVGIRLNNANNTVIGGTGTGERNVVAGHSVAGMDILLSTGSIIRNNYVGTDAGGTSNLGNTVGIQIAQGPNNVVGGAGAGEGNLIAWNGTGVRFGPASVGGVTGNTIRDNTGIGVDIVTGTGAITIAQNTIHSNGALGIDLAPNGITANDPQDADAGPNGLQNFPVISSAYLGSTVIDGTLNSTPSGSFTLEFFSGATCDLSGNGEGQTFLTSLTGLIADVNGDATFSHSIPTNLAVGTAVTATARDESNGNTSEFSNCVTVADFSVVATPTSSLSVPIGTSATFDVAVAAVGGTFSGTVALSCPGLPVGVVCNQWGGRSAARWRCRARVCPWAWSAISRRRRWSPGPARRRRSSRSPRTTPPLWARSRSPSWEHRDR
jgi:CSLREA domain-containing protein